MSYYTQRIANKFPLWSTLRMDPSSMGHRFLTPIGKIQELDLHKSLRLKKFNQAIVSGETIFDLPNLWYIDLRELSKKLNDISDAPIGIYGFRIENNDGTTVRVLRDSYLVQNGIKAFGEDLAVPHNCPAQTISDFLYSIPSRFVPVPRARQGLVLADIALYPPLKVFSDAVVALQNGTLPANYTNRMTGIWSNDPKYLLPSATYTNEVVIDDTAQDLYMPILQMGSIQNPLRFDVVENRAVEEKRSFRIGVEVVGSTRYKRWSDEERRRNNIDYGVVIPDNGHHKVLVRGKDENNDDITESIFIKDDGYYLTQQKFTSVEPIDNPEGGPQLPPVEHEGFNGYVTLTLSDARAKTKICPWHIAIMSDSDNSFGPVNTNSFEYLDINSGKPIASNATEGPLHLELSYPDNPLVAGSFLDSYFHIYTNGQSYRRPEVELEAEEDNRELICSQYLLDEFGTPFKAVDFTFNWWDMKTYILDDKGKLHVFELGPTPFSEWSLKRTTSIDVEIKPLDYRAVYGESIPLWSWHRVLRRAIKNIAFMRESPEDRAIFESSPEDNRVFQPDYLQADYTWSKEKYFFGGTDDIDKPETSWQDIKFTTGFPFLERPDQDTFTDQELLDLEESERENLPKVLGQWNFYCETILRSNEDLDLARLEKLYVDGQIVDASYHDLKKELLRKQEDGLVTEMFHRSCTAVMCEFLQAKRTYDLPGINLLSEIPWGLYTDGTENEIHVLFTPRDPVLANMILVPVKYKPERHGCYIDYATDKIFFREPYDFLRLTWPGEGGFEDVDEDGFPVNCLDAMSEDFVNIDHEDKTNAVCIDWILPDLPISTTVIPNFEFESVDDGENIVLTWKTTGDLVWDQNLAQNVTKLPERYKVFYGPYEEGPYVSTLITAAEGHSPIVLNVVEELPADPGDDIYIIPELLEPEVVDGVEQIPKYLFTYILTDLPEDVDIYIRLRSVNYLGNESLNSETELHVVLEGN